MKKKAISILMCAIMLVAMLTGCIHQDMGVKMNRDGSGSITATLGIEKDFYEQLKDIGSDPFEGKSVTEYEYDGSTYVAYAESKKYSSYEEMEKALLEMTYETELIEDAQNAEAEEDTDMTDEEDSGDIFDVTVDEEEDATADIEAPSTDKLAQDNHIFSSVNIEKNSGIFYSSYTFNAVLNPQNGEELDYDPNETFRVTLSVEMPGEITSSKGGTAEGNKIVFDIADITESQELSAICEENNTGVVIGIVIGLVVLVGGLVCLFKFKK